MIRSLGQKALTLLDRLGGIHVKNSGEGSHGGKLRIILTVLIAAACIVFSGVFFVLMLRNYPGMEIAFFASMMFSALFAVYLLLRKLRTNEKYAKLSLILQRCLYICIAAGMVGFLVLQGLIMSGARTEDSEVDCLIILGAGIYGEYPSITLVSRLDAALEYMQSRGSVQIIVSGGQGPGETITEAEAMFRYLTRRGVDESNVWKEDASTNTWENLAFSFELMKTKGMDPADAKIAIVTNEFHLYRAKHIAGTLGAGAIGVAAQTPYLGLRILYHCREAVALLKDFLLSR